MATALDRQFFRPMPSKSKCPIALVPKNLATLDRSPALNGTVGDPAAVITVTILGTTYPATNNGDGTWTLPDNTITPDITPDYEGIPVIVRANCPDGSTGVGVGTIAYPNVLLEDNDNGGGTGFLIEDNDGKLLGDNQ